MQPIDNMHITVPAGRINGNGAAGGRVYSEILHQAVDDKKVACRTGLAKSGGQESLKADQTSVPERSFAIQYVDTFENVLGNHADLALIILGSSG